MASTGHPALQADHSQLFVPDKCPAGRARATLIYHSIPCAKYIFSSYQGFATPTFDNQEVMVMPVTVAGSYWMGLAKAP